MNVADQITEYACAVEREKGISLGWTLTKIGFEAARVYNATVDRLCAAHGSLMHARCLSELEIEDCATGERAVSTLGQFIEANAEDRALCVDVACLCVGESATTGGGAFPLCRVTRIL